MVRFRSVPSFSVNFRSFLDFGTASQASILTTLKSDLLNVSKSTSSANKGSIFTLERSICTLGADTVAASAEPFTAAFSALFSARFGSRVFIVGKRMTSRMVLEFVSSITQRSMPIPMPPVGGMPYSKAVRKSSSSISASSSPRSRCSACLTKRSRWSMGSFSSE